MIKSDSKLSQINEVIKIVINKTTIEPKDTPSHI